MKEDSAVIAHINAGDVLEMTYYVNEPPGTLENLQTRIQHITMNDSGRFKGHYLIGLSIE